MPQTRTQAEDSLSWITARLLGEVGQQHRRRVILLRTTWISHYVTLGGRCWAAVTGRSQGLFTVTSSVWKCTVALERRTVTAPSHWGNHLTGSVSAGGHRGWTCGCRICSEELTADGYSRGDHFPLRVTSLTLVRSALSVNMISSLTSELRIYLLHRPCPMLSKYIYSSTA